MKYSRLGICFVLLLASSARASIWYEENPAIKPGIPDIGWVSTDPELVGHGGYCGYVAAANVITYWDSNGMPNLVDDGCSADQLMTNLKPYLYQGGSIPGTSCDEIETGMRNYFKDKGYESVITIKQYTTEDITLKLIQDEMKRCEQVILGLDNPAHWVTTAGWAEIAGDTWLGVHDPNDLQSGGANLGGAEDYYETSTESDGLHLNYDNLMGLVDNIITVSQVPEPISIIIWLTIFILVCMNNRQGHTTQA